MSAAATVTHTSFCICVSPECEVFAATEADHVDADGTLVARTWHPVGPFHDSGPDHCLAALVADGDVPADAQLGRWHRLDDAEITGYWTIETL